MTQCVSLFQFNATREQPQHSVGGRWSTLAGHPPPHRITAGPREGGAHQNQGGNEDTRSGIPPAGGWTTLSHTGG